MKKIKIKVKCRTCKNKGKCSINESCWMEDFGEPNERSFCKNRGLIMWFPKEKYQAEFCADCPMWGTTLGYSKGDPKHTKCDNHSDPCWKNPHHRDMKTWDTFLIEYRIKFKR